MMHVYFINYNSFHDSSGIHIHFLANALQSFGIPCTACVPRSPKSVHTFGRVAYQSMTFAKLARKTLLNPDSFRREEAIFHAWTPREVVRRMTVKAAVRTGCPYFVHLEDNEEHVFETHIGLDVKRAAYLPWYRKAILPRGFIRPGLYRPFMKKSAGVTCIMESLRATVPDPIPTTTFWPACEPDFYDLPLEPDLPFRKELSLPNDAVVLTYTGNLHKTNRDEIATLYEAVAILNEQGKSVRLIRTGTDHANLPDTASAARPYVLDLGSRAPEELIRYIGAADILVQPGRPGPFNDYRFPSKLPMYLASGRPVILPATNIGLHLTDGTECRLLKKGTTRELVEMLKPLVEDADLRRAIGTGGRTFARNNFNWDKSAASVLDFYQRTIGNVP